MNQSEVKFYPPNKLLLFILGNERMGTWPPLVVNENPINPTNHFACTYNGERCILQQTVDSLKLRILGPGTSDMFG